MSSHSSSNTSSPPRFSRYVLQSSDVLEDARINVLDEQSSSVIWFKERYLGDHEIVDHVVHNSTSTICWTVHKPLKGWYIRIRSPTFPPGVFIPLMPLSPRSPHYGEAALTFTSRTSIPSVKDAEISIQASASASPNTSTVHSYPPTPPAVPSLVLQPASPPASPKSTTKPTSLDSEHSKISWTSTSTTDFVIAPYLPAATSPSLFSRIVSAIKDRETLGSNSFTISRIAVQAPPPYVSTGTMGIASLASSSPTSLKCLPLLTFRDRTSFLTARSMNGLLELDQAEECLLGVDTAFWIAVALTYLDFLNDRASYLAALND
ncbi:hypothetical protein E1B28_013369 [Marasmius oreades]|uniref:Uncharacterized protein n=1 Tax=Marasmius oreades TaxID=181124 RepID=A0A9P7RPL7_9AGAR|nr:uncharacterized protein E1B28_013369 [Marasmius oreades]KAG7087399.1 hypothetical protein E1B28_013369 [Marasmius oreades]